MNTRAVIVVLAGFSVAGIPPSAQASMSEIERRVAAQRACQAAIWAVPAVDVYDIAHAIRRDLGGETGDVVSMSRPMVSRHGFLTANDVTPYSVGALTTKNGPLVVELPPAAEKTTFFGTFVDSWMRPVADVGPTGFDEGKGGKYLFLPPGYEGAVPEGYLVFPLETFGVHFAFRPVSRDGGTVEEAAAYSRRVKVYPLSKAASPPQTRHIDAFPKAWNTLPVYDITLFEDIWNVVQSEPVLERDRAMMGLLASIGIVNGQPFAPGPELKAALEEGAQCAFDYLQDRFTTPGETLVPYWGGKNQWQVVNVPRDQVAAGFPFETDDRRGLLPDVPPLWSRGSRVPEDLGPGGRGKGPMTAHCWGRIRRRSHSHWRSR